MTDLLLVEDDPVIVSTLSDFLRSEGFSVSVAGGQRQAMAQLAAGHIHTRSRVVGLPDGSGFALCSAIKAQYNIPVIFLTALDDEISTVTGLDLGATTILPSLSGPGNWSAAFGACCAGAPRPRLS